MNMSQFYSEFLFRYQTEAAPQKISINAFCLREGIEYRNFIRWYRDNKKKMREAEMQEIMISPITVTGKPVEATAPVSKSVKGEANAINVEKFHIKLSNGIEINKESANLETITTLLQSLQAIC